VYRGGDLQSRLRAPDAPEALVCVGRSVNRTDQAVAVAAMAELKMRRSKSTNGAAGGEAHATPSLNKPERGEMGWVGDCSSCRVKGAAIQADARAQAPISLTAYLTGFDEFGGSALRHCRKGPQRVGRAFGFDASKPSVSTQLLSQCDARGLVARDLAGRGELPLDAMQRRGNK
jgi:hypothetical protein